MCEAGFGRSPVLGSGAADPRTATADQKTSRTRVDVAQGEKISLAAGRMDRGGIKLLNRVTGVVERCEPVLDKKGRTKDVIYHMLFNRGNQTWTVTRTPYEFEVLF